MSQMTPLCGGRILKMDGHLPAEYCCLNAERLFVASMKICLHAQRLKTYLQWPFMLSPSNFLPTVHLELPKKFGVNKKFRKERKSRC